MITWFSGPHFQTNQNCGAFMNQGRRSMPQGWADPVASWLPGDAVNLKLCISKPSRNFQRLKWLKVMMDDYEWLMREVLFLAVSTFCCFWEEWTMSNPDSWRSGHMIYETHPGGASLLHCFTASPIFSPSFWSFDSFWLNGSEDFYASKSEGSKWAISDLCAYAGEAWCQGRFLDGGWWRSKAFYGFVCPQLKDHAPAKWAGEKY